MTTKSKPILFSSAMVKAILEGKKTQTRRIVKESAVLSRDQRKIGFQYSLAHARPGNVAEMLSIVSGQKYDGPVWQQLNVPVRHPDDAVEAWDDCAANRIYCPYGEPGDKLTVKEAAWMWCERRPNGTTPKGRQKWHYVPMKSAGVIYVAYHPERPTLYVVSPETGNKWGWHFKSGRFLPKWAVRITLGITAVRAERLQEISEPDAQAEGVCGDLTDDMIKVRAAQCELKDEYWIHGADEGESYCYDCCKKEAARLLAEKPELKNEICVDGGWETEGDSTSFCEKCGAMLSNSFTDYGAEQELDHFLEHGVNLKSAVDCYCVQNALGNVICGNPESEKSKRLLSVAARIGYRILWDSINGEKHPWASNPWVWVVEFKKV